MTINGKIIIREYDGADCRRLAELFYETVHNVNIRDYSKAQTDAWAPKIPDISEWDKVLSGNDAFVAEIGGYIAGFGSIDGGGHLDMLFVDKSYQRKGVGTALCEKLEEAAKGMDIDVYASLTARPFFEKRGYTVIRKQEAERNGVALHNFIMKKYAVSP